MPVELELHCFFILGTHRCCCCCCSGARAAGCSRAARAGTRCSRTCSGARSRVENAPSPHLFGKDVGIIWED